MKETVACCRTAFVEPSDPVGGVSAQAASLREYAEQNGMTVDDTYIDAGASGMTLIRPALQQLIADCRAGKIQVVLTTDTDRLPRDTGQLAASHATLTAIRCPQSGLEDDRRDGGSSSR
jgi:DNA invertase Pin-like site-specific DNA recombinase